MILTCISTSLEFTVNADQKGHEDTLGNKKNRPKTMIK
jgi:hypothetical protein